MDEFCVIVLGGEVASSLPDYARKSRFVLCADNGAEHARRLGLRCDAIVGDLDSIAFETRRYYEAQNVPIVHLPEQEHNDFEKTLDYLSRQWRGEVLVFGMTGGRLDHTLSNLSVMLRHSSRFEMLRAINDAAEYQFLTDLRKQCTIECEPGTTISLIPFGVAYGIVTENLLYPLNTETLELGVREGISNRAAASPVRISLASGALLVCIARN